MVPSGNAPETIFFDSSAAFYCAADIGYRWAVKVKELVARGNVRGVTDALYYQEILDRFTYLGDLQKGETLFRTMRRLMHETVAVTEDDFLRSYELYQQYPKISPRILLRAAVMINHTHLKICATFAAGIEQMSGIQRVNLMDKIEEIERISD
jgi:hypothetical protein